jgi:hypothetical protein
MNARKSIILTLSVLLGMVIVSWLGYEYRDEVRTFLRTLMRIL